MCVYAHIVNGTKSTCAYNPTGLICPTSQIVNGTKNTCTYNHQRERLRCMLLTANGDGIIKNAPIPFAEGVGVWLLKGLDCGYRWVNVGLKPSTHRATAAKRTPSTRRSATRWRTDRAIAVVVGPVIAHLLTCLFATEKI